MLKRTIVSAVHYRSLFSDHDREAGPTPLLVMFNVPLYTTVFKDVKKS